MSAPRFKVGDRVMDGLGIIGTILAIFPGDAFPYRILENDGWTARHAEAEGMHLADREARSDTVSASKVAGGVEVPGGANEAAGEASSPREQWTFLGREVLWERYTFLIWTLTANPTGRREIGTRHARFLG